MQKPLLATSALVLLFGTSTVTAAQTSDTDVEQDSAGENTPSESDNEVIVVTAKSLKQTGEALADCIARDCPPEEDIRLSLEHAENLFVAGEYRDSGSTLRSSLGRNKRYGDDLPVPVSGLQRAYARVSENLGEAKDFQLATLDMRDTLKGGLGKEDPRTLVAEISVGDSRAKLGQPDDAERIYKKIEKRAIKLGQPRVAMFARMRLALLSQSRYDAEKREFWREEMMERLHDIRDNPLPGGEEFKLVAEVMLAKLDRKAGNADSTEALVKRFAENGGVNRPVLLFTEPLRSDAELDREANRASNVTARLTTMNRFEPQWVDIGFWINPEGRVEEIDILRSEGNTDWAKRIASNISKRIYAPLKQDGSTPGFYMIERYTLTARFADSTTGTRLRKREPIERIERIDLTPENYNRAPS